MKIANITLCEDMDINKRALYNSLRMNWLIDPSLEVDDWQVANYREMSLSLLFSKLREFDLDFKKDSFCSIADGYDTPEELTESLIDHEEVDAVKEDQIYLLIFELWRRLQTEKPCLSVFCDELDHQIFLYDLHQTSDVEAVQDILANLQVILDENVDEGADPTEILSSVNKGCANDIETFLYDFITEQIDNENDSYALELLEGFIDYIEDDKWFELLRVRLIAHSDPETAQNLIRHLIEEAAMEDDLQFNLEILAEMMHGSDLRLFKEFVTQTTKLLKSEEDFQDLLTVCLDYYSCHDQDNKEQQLLKILDHRSHIQMSDRFNNKDKDLEQLFFVLNQ